MRLVLAVSILFSTVAFGKTECGHVTIITLSEKAKGYDAVCPAIITDNPSFDLSCPTSEAISLAQTAFSTGAQLCIEHVVNENRNLSVNELTLRR